MSMLGALRAAARASGAMLPTSSLRILAAVIAGTRVGAGCRVFPGCRLGPRCTIGDNCRLGRLVHLKANVHLGDGCVVGDGARLRNLTAGDGTHLETNVLCIGAREGRIRIGNHSYIGVGALLDYSSDVTPAPLPPSTPIPAYQWLSTVWTSTVIAVPTDP
jgi:UDP-3-O-[3-hydroxymyristoyl] glucosamine N-acyltransferase